MSRTKVETLDQAIDEARNAAEGVRRDGGLPTAKGFRDYEPDERVNARIEISGPGLLRGKEGGLDVMGDGTLVAYTGAIRKRKLGGDSVDDALQRLMEALD